MYGYKNSLHNKKLDFKSHLWWFWNFVGNSFSRQSLWSWLVMENWKINITYIGRKIYTGWQKKAIYEIFDFISRILYPNKRGGLYRVKVTIWILTIFLLFKDFVEKKTVNSSQRNSAKLKMYIFARNVIKKYHWSVILFIWKKTTQNKF